jgi:Ulp1 family protease
MSTWYRTFFEPEVDKRFKDTQVTARVGGQYIRINDLKTLGPAEWLNDTIIDRMTDILTSKCDTNSERRAAVFDSQFKMINEHPQSDDPRFNRKLYHYNRVRTYAHRKLRGRSPVTIDCIIFPNNVRNRHWNVYPTQRHIVGLDSMHVNSCVDARTIFRWLFDKTSYNYPGDVDKLFQPHLKDMGWTFRVDTEVPRQIHGYSCGVFLLGYVACVLYEMSPLRLTPMLVQGYCIRLFGECSSQRLNTDLLCIKRHKSSPWISEKSSRIILDPIPITQLLPNKALWATASSRRFVLPSERVKLNFESFQERAQAQRKARAAEAEKQKEEKTERKRIRAEAKKARLEEIKE